MKVVTLMRLKDQEERLISAFPNIEFTFYKYPGEADERVLAEADVLVSYHSELNQMLLEKCKNLKLIAWYATGVNRLPLDYIEERGIILTNAKGVHAIQIAEFVFAYILNDIKLFKETYEAQKRHAFLNKLTPDSINEKTILFLGTGKIPQQTAKIARAFNMNIIGINTDGRHIDGFDEVYSIEERRHVFARADFIVNVLPETKETIHLLDEEDFKAMNNHAHFINVGRGTIISEAVLVEALKKEEIRFASIDVFEEEPLVETSQLYDMDNVMITPHITGNDKNNLIRSTDILIDNLKQLADKKNSTFKNVVNTKQGY